MLDRDSVTEERNYKAYIGVPEEYDFMGASQFRLLCKLGLRAEHKLLDIGCGSLRAGRFFITYLNESCYHGVEPNQWLIEDAIKYEIGRDIISIKKPVFNYKSDFSINEFGTTFDFVIAQSIFTHTGIDLLKDCLSKIKMSLREQGIVLATFKEGDTDTEGDNWTYPDVVTFRPNTITNIAHDLGFVVTSIPWYRPRQTWYAFAKTQDRLPSTAMMSHLQDEILFDAEHRKKQIM